MKKIYIKPVVEFDEIESEDLLNLSDTSTTDGSGNGGGGTGTNLPGGPSITEGEDLASKGFGGFIFDNDMDW